MDILAPDEANFEHLIQVDKNIQPHIKNMSRILTNSIEILIVDSFNRAIDIHSHLPDLNFPLSEWIAYTPVHHEKLLKILSNTPGKNLPTLIENIVSIKASKFNFKSPFVFSFLFSEDAQSIIEKKYNYSEFQKLVLKHFIKELPKYKDSHNTFAFAEIFKIDSLLLSEHNSIFNDISEKHIEHFFFKTFKNDFVYSLFDKKESFFKYFSIDIIDYLKSTRNNPLIEKFIEKCIGIDPLNNQEFPTLFPEEIQIIQKLKTEHDFLILNSKLPPKNILTKHSKI